MNTHNRHMAGITAAIASLEYQVKNMRSMNTWNVHELVLSTSGNPRRNPSLGPASDPHHARQCSGTFMASAYPTTESPPTPPTSSLCYRHRKRQPNGREGSDSLRRDPRASIPSAVQSGAIPYRGRLGDSPGRGEAIR